jgi:hypothetical protein
VCKGAQHDGWCIQALSLGRCAARPTCVLRYSKWARLDRPMPSVSSGAPGAESQPKWRRASATTLGVARKGARRGPTRATGLSYLMGGEGVSRWVVGLEAGGFTAGHGTRATSAPGLGFRV